MDIEKLTKETILKNMSPEQQKAVLESVMASVQESKKARSVKIAENVDLVMQALKKIEASMLARVEKATDLAETAAKNVKDGKDGRDGKDGKDGKQGSIGPKGADGRNGKDGKDGKDGRDGVDGVSVVNAFLDFDNSLVIELSNGKQINVGGMLADDTAEKVRIVANGGGTSQGVLDALAALQAEIDNFQALPSQTGNAGKFLTTDGTNASWASVAGGLSYQGTWNASTNSPTLASSTGTNGYYYVVNTAGSTNLDGITDWQVGDWLLFNGTAWQKIDQTNLVTSVAGRTGAVTLSTSDISGLGTIATQNANNVTITGGTAALTSLNTATIQATNSGGLSLKNSAGNTQINLGAGGGDNISLNVSTNLNGSNAQIDISPTGTGHVHIKPTGSGSLEIAPTNLGTLDNMAIGGVTPAAITGTTITATTYAGGNVSNWNTAYGWGNHASAGYLTTSAAASTYYPLTNPSGYTNNIGTVTSVGGTGTVNGLTLTGTVTSSGSLTLGGTLSNIANSALTNSAITFGSTSQALGSTVSAINGVSLGQSTPAAVTGTVVTGSSIVASNGILVNSQTISSDYTIATGNNGGSFGPVSVASGVTVTVASGSVWTIV